MGTRAECELDLICACILLQDVCEGNKCRCIMWLCARMCSEDLIDCGQKSKEVLCVKPFETKLRASKKFTFKMELGVCFDSNWVWSICATQISSMDMSRN